jgi:hypothetical protein
MHCEPALTQIIVEVDTSAAPTVDNVALDVAGPSGRSATHATGSNGPRYSVGLVPTSPDVASVTITASGYHGADLVVQRVATASFVAGETRVVWLTLRAACTGVMCGDGQSCGEQCCAPVDVPTTSPADDGGFPGVTSVASIPADNLTVDPSFETGTTPWTGYYTSLESVVASDAPDGCHVARVSASQPSTAYYTIDDSMTSVRSYAAGQTYTATAWVRASGAASLGRPAFITIRENPSSGARVPHESSPVMLTDTFQRVSVTTTTTTQQGTLSVYVAIEAATISDAFDADAITLVLARP